MVANDAELGDYLVDGSGTTLYLSTQDQGTTTACTGGRWRTGHRSSPRATRPEATASTPRCSARPTASSRIQVTDNGHLLDYFHEDTASGHTNGVGLLDRLLVDLAGEAIEGQPAQAVPSDGPQR